MYRAILDILVVRLEVHLVISSHASRVAVWLMDARTRKRSTNGLGRAYIRMAMEADF
jgi:hypothetical protein